MSDTHLRVDGADPANEAVTTWLSTATSRLRVDPPPELLPAALATVPAVRRRRRLTFAVPAGVATITCVVIALAVVLTNGPNGGTASLPLSRLGPAGIPLDVPTGDGQPKVPVRIVNTSRILTLSAADQAAVTRGCGPEPRMTDVPGIGDVPSGPSRILTAVQDRYGTSVLVAAGDHWTEECPVPTAKDGSLDFNRMPTKQYAWAVNQPHDLARAPDAPIELFHAATSFGGDTGGLVTWLAGGRISSRVAVLFAALPTGEATVVPVDPNTGAFITRIELALPVPLDEKTIAGSPLGLYAYDATGTLIFQVHES
ncbi:hypothetical protein [Pseudofrankia asymbiotica]|uniref:Uncharacterized protein n=1 Tax=Pseudofrankia asymbiotica TaxID=1834516 RepID=A0A1V2I8G8_9ACTN|nr:hypothetical protein [Pseudofrankia asymbiotica]ONH28677.1 hypothetical protein BL253_19070 [Pseudofrankia asymbiotica]